MPVRIGHVHIYNKDGSTLIGSLNGDSTFNITSEGVIANMYSQTVSFSNSNVIGYAETPNATTPDYPIGSNDINIGDGISDTSIYEVEADKYTINATKSKITINCQDKTMEKDIIVRFTKTPTQTKTSEFNPGSANSITITPDQGYVLSSVQVNKPATMISDNIKKDVNIGGVIGTYEGSGGGGSSEDRLKKFLDTTKSAKYLFSAYTGTSVDDIIQPNDTENVTTMHYMFDNCSNLTSIPQFNTSKVTTMQGMFRSCTNLTTIPQLNTSNVTNMQNMFSSCTNLTAVPVLDTSNVTTMMNMFYDCTALTTIPQLNTSNATNMQNMFSGCTNLTTIPTLDVGKVANLGGMFSACSKLKSILMTNIGVALDIHFSTKFEREDLLVILNNLKTVTSSKKLTMGATNLAKLTEEDKSIATNKG